MATRSTLPPLPDTPPASQFPRPAHRRRTRSAGDALTEPVPEAVGTVDTSFLESLVGYNTRRAALAVISVFMQRMEPYGLRVVDFSVLTLIAHNPGITSRQLCAALAILPPNLVGMIKDLEKRGLVQKRPHPVDRRAQGLHLTEAGATLQAETQSVVASLENEAVTHLTDSERGTLLTLLRKIYRQASS